MSSTKKRKGEKDKKRKRKSYGTSSKKRKRSSDIEMKGKKIKRVEEKFSDEIEMSGDLKRCLNLLNKVMKLPLSVEFNQPVDWEYWKLWEYPKIVTHPMDLGSVKTFLENGEIINMEHFADNVRLTFLNAMKFHQEGTGIYNSARSLLLFFDFKFEELDVWVRTGEKPKPIDFCKADFVSKLDMDPEMLSLSTEIKNMTTNIKQKNAEIARLKQCIERPIDRVITLVPPITPFSFEERDDLCTKMTHLTQDDISGLVDIVNPDETPDDDDEWELDLETLDDYTFSKVKAYVQKCIERNGNALNTHDKLEIANRESSVRILELQRQLKGVSLSKHLSVGMYVAVNPNPDQGNEIFWIGKVVELPANSTVKVQWFELDELIDENERYYRLTNKADAISVLSVYFSVSVYLSFETDKKLYRLTDFIRTVEECKNYSIDSD